RQQGISDEQLARIHAPIGLNIGGRTPEEVALSIAAEIVAVRRGPRSSDHSDSLSIAASVVGGVG
ncbi:MAG TPA: XdhC family protein, partial [Chloroflexota bacterium]|nr:XdhC family protein [Chloroflexota bacterium]